MGLRFSFDLGTNSIGWAVYRLDGAPKAWRLAELLDCGSRIFSDGRNPKDGTSLAVMRRGPRAMRRRRDRYLQRRDWLMTLLVRHGLMPDDVAERKALEGLDPYVLRARALDEPLEPHEIGRALFQLNQRRGFKSNRIADSDDSEKGKIKSAEARLKERLKENGFRTLGEFYAARQRGPVRQRQTVRARLRGQGAKAFYDFYPTRDLIADEFDEIWEAQRTHHPDLLSDDAREAIRGAMLFQRPLKPVDPGKCTFVPGEPRLAKAHPLAQQVRIYQELANLGVEESGCEPRKLTLEERDRLAEPLLAGEDLTFGKIRKALGLGGADKINLEEGGRDKLKGDEVVARLGGKSGKLKRLWAELSAEDRAAVALRVAEEPEAETLTAWLEAKDATAEEAKAATAVRLPDGYTRIGPTATGRILDALRAGNGTGYAIVYSEAAKQAGYHHSDERTGEIRDALPYYGEVLERHVAFGTGDPADPLEKRVGKIANPTVHIGLNQLRRVINRLIEAHGHPDQIVLELARELKSSLEEKDKLKRLNEDNRKANERRRALLNDPELGYPPNAGNLRLLRLWEELQPYGSASRQCVYTGGQISLTELFSDAVEVEHILPFSQTLDDGMTNKTLCLRQFNREKRNLAPEEAYGARADYDAMLARAEALPPNKRWRFKPGAMEKYRDENRDFLARQLNETRYLSRIAKTYVSKVCDPNEVWVNTGQLTALLRRKWGLSGILPGSNRNPDGEDDAPRRKSRDDHRHHAVDAIAIGAIDRGLLQRLAGAAADLERQGFERVIADVPEPFPGFLDQARDRVLSVAVSHKPEHGRGGALHEDTAYGIVSGPDQEEGDLVRRKPIDALSPGEVDSVRDRRLRDQLQAVKAEARGDKKKLAQLLGAWGEQHNVRRVRVLKTEAGFVPIADKRTGEPYKAVIAGENHHMDVVEAPNGAWRGFAASVFEVNQREGRPAWRDEVPDGKLVMRLHKNDLVEVTDDDGVRRIKRVVKLNPASGRVILAGHAEAGALQERHDAPDDLFRWDLASISRLKDRRCRPVKIDEIGAASSG